MMKKMRCLKMKSQSLNLTSPKNSRSSSRMRMLRQVTRIANNLDFLNLNLKIDLRENPKKLDKVAKLQPVQNAMVVKGTNI